MTRVWTLVLAALGVAACTGESLSAGSNELTIVDARSPVSRVAAASTRATLMSMIDTFAMDADNLYFTAEDGLLYRLAKTGTSAPVLLGAAAVAGSNYTEGLTLDATNLYWTALGDGTSSGAVLSVSIAGGAVTTLATNQARPTGIAVDESTVYWSNQGAPAPTAGDDGENNADGVMATIMSLPKAGGMSTVLVDGPDTPDALTLDPTGVIWHERYAIRRVPKTGGATTTLTEVAIAWACSNLVVADDTLYWAADQGGWSLQSVPLTGGVVATLAPTIEAPGSILVDTADVLWDVAAGQAVGAIEVLPMGASETVASSPDLIAGSRGEQASFFLADASAFYWVEYWTTPGATAPTVTVRVLAR